MKVTFLRSFGSIFGDHQPSSEPMEIPDEYAKNWIQVGFAAPKRGYGVPIDTVFPRSYAEYTRDEIESMGAAEQHEFIKTHNLEVPGYKKSMKAAELEKVLLTFLNFATE